MTILNGKIHYKWSYKQRETGSQSRTFAARLGSCGVPFKTTSLLKQSRQPRKLKTGRGQSPFRSESQKSRQQPLSFWRSGARFNLFTAKNMFWPVSTAWGHSQGTRVLQGVATESVRWTLPWAAKLYAHIAVPHTSTSIFQSSLHTGGSAEGSLLSRLKTIFVQYHDDSMQLIPPQGT